MWQTSAGLWVLPSFKRVVQFTLLSMISRALSILAGDLLRDEAKREGSTHGELIRDIMNEGKNVPMSGW